jgi:hypothetical protein
VPRPTVGVVQPSSLIFLVIVAIWVAYLIQHWVRRREHLATARSVDRFSEAMRVLERRSPLPATMLAAAKAEAPSPAARPEVVVKRASVSSPLRARRGSSATASVDSAESSAGGSGGPAHPVPPIELVPHRTTLQIVLRRVRGILFLAALVAVPATLVLSAMHILKWLSLTLAVVALAAVVVWLRVAAVQEQKARRARRAELRRLERVRAGEVSMAPVAPMARVSRREPVVPEAPAVPEVAREVDPNAWNPVPVPPPTYTLKEPAHRPEPATPRPVPIEVEDDEIEVMAARHGRRLVGH